MNARFLLPLVGGFLSLLAGTTGESGSRESFAKNHPVRRRLLDLILRRPGIRLATLWKTLESNRKTTKYHLMILEHANVVASYQAERVTRYFPARVGPEERPLVSLLLRGRVLEMISAIVRHPGISQVELQKSLTMSRKLLREYANLLTETQLLDEIRGPHSRRYYPTERLEQVLGHVSAQTQEDEKAQSPPAPPRRADSHEPG